MFPNPIPLPEEVASIRKARSQALTRIAFYGVIIRIFIAVIELIGYFIFDSSVLLLDALSTFTDVTSSLLLIFSIKLAERPPDQNHPFGHGRYEPLVGLQLGIFLAIGGIGMFWHECGALWQNEPREAMNSSAFILPLIAVCLLEMSYRKMISIAKREKSPALEAEAYHFRIDGLNSVLALIALAMASFFPSWSAFFDHLGAIGISLFMVSVGIHNAKNNVNQLLDRVPEKQYFDMVRKAAKEVPGVFDTEKIRIQLYGPDAHVDIDIEVDPHLDVDTAHKISQQVRSSIQRAWPHVREVIVHIEPYYANDHTLHD